MSSNPKTDKKLREAHFFFRLLRENGANIRLDLEDFDFYVSAFLSAGRSVTWVLQAEAKDQYDAWFPGWCNKLDTDQRELFDFMKGQRNKELKSRSSGVRSEIRHIAVTEVVPGSRAHPTYGIHWWAPPGTPPPEVGVRTYYFERNGTAQDAVETCSRYLEILQNLIEDFRRHRLS